MPMNQATPATPTATPTLPTSEDSDLNATRAARPAQAKPMIDDALNSQTPWNVQAKIDRTRPDLWAAVSKNPALYPDLKAWLDRHINR